MKNLQANIKCPKKEASETDVKSVLTGINF
jgi:hypothetical protein